MSRETVEVVRRQFEAVNERDFAKVMALYDEDVELIAPPDYLTSGTYSGKEAVGEWFGDWFRTFGAASFELLELLDNGDAVAVVAHHTAEGKRSGLEISANFFYAYWVKDGKVVRVQFCDSREEALAAAGIEE